MYNRKGRQLLSFKTALPGGSPRTNRNSFTILDGIWLVDKKTFYVLDTLAWSNQDMIDCEVRRDSILILQTRVFNPSPTHWVKLARMP